MLAIIRNVARFRGPPTLWNDSTVPHTRLDTVPSQRSERSEPLHCTTWYGGADRTVARTANIILSFTDLTIYFSHHQVLLRKGPLLSLVTLDLPPRPGFCSN
jgi:hypothetical protein